MPYDPVQDDVADDRALLRLFRSTIGHEPPHGALRPLLAARRAGQDLQALAHGLLATPAGRALHGGPEGIVDAAFATRAVAGAACGHPGELAAALASMLVGLGRPQALALLAETPLFRDDGPDLPVLYADRRPDDPDAYRHWRRHHEATDGPECASTLSFGLVVPVADTTIEAAATTLEWLERQSHVAWSLVLAGTLRSRWARDQAAALAGRARVSVVAGDAWSALRACRADAACMLAPGDRLAPHALAHVALALEEPGASLAFTDEDVWDPVAGRSRPRFKMPPSMETMQAGDAVGGLAALRTSLLARLGDARGPALARAAMALDPAGVRHVPRVLLHAAADRRPWAPGPRSGQAPQALRISVIVPTRDRADLLRTVAHGVLHGTAHTALELILVDHASTDPEALELLARLAEDPRVRVLRDEGPFNFAALNNRAAAVATGDVLALLNNDVAIHDPAWLGELASLALRPDVGAVGAKLLDRAGRIQHGGIALGPDGAATHLFRGAATSDPGYENMLAMVRDVGAVTGACLALRRDVWRAVGGMDEAFPVTWNDVDLCQRVRRAGLRVLWTPHAVLSHLEGQTRGSDANPAAQAAFLADGARYRALWGTAADADPWLNPNLVASETELCLAPPRLPGRTA